MLFQLLANGLITGLNYGMLALGFSLIYFTTKIFHFSHGAVYSFAAYAYYFLHLQLNFHFLISFIISVTLSSIFGILIDFVIYLPLDRRNSSKSIQMISSLALYVIVVNLIVLLFGNEIKILTLGMQKTHILGSLILTETQIVIFIISISLFIIFFLFFKFSRIGLIIRAYKDDNNLLSILGINPARVRLFIFAIGSALTGIASILSATDIGLDPYLGMSAILNSMVASVIGGVGVFQGSIVGALILGVSHTLIVLKVNAQWQDAFTFLLLVIFIIFRPQGIIGIKRRIEED